MMGDSILTQAHALVQSGEFDQAKTLLLAHPEVTNSNINGKLLLGTVLLFLGDPANAHGLLRTAMDALPEYTLVKYYFGYAAMMTGDTHTAITVLQSIPSNDPLREEANRVLANIEEVSFASNCYRLEQISKRLVTYHLRPMHSQDYGLRPDTPSLSRQLAIVIQGPVLADNSFTLETVRLYRNLFPLSLIIVSTWEDEPEDALSSLEASGAMVLKNAKPTKNGALLPGISNINMQISSARAGISVAVEFGYRYTLKTRTDFRLYNTSFLANAITLLSAYPLQTATKQRERLIAFSDVIKYMPYAVPDKNMFGNTLDMLDYWSPPLDDRTGLSPGTLMGMAQFGVGESYMLTRYMSFLGRNPNWTYSDSWSILRDHFVFMDQSAADMYWHKYQRHREFRWQQYSLSTTFADFGFSEWLRLYVGRIPMVCDERIGDLGGGVPIDTYLAEYNQKAID